MRHGFKYTSGASELGAFTLALTEIDFHPSIQADELDQVS